MEAKLWQVGVLIKLYVLADSETRAEELAATYVDKELRDPQARVAVEAREVPPGQVDARWRGRKPYGECGPAEGPTCGEIATDKDTEETGS